MATKHAPARPNENPERTRPRLVRAQRVLIAAAGGNGACRVRLAPLHEASDALASLARECVVDVAWTPPRDLLDAASRFAALPDPGASDAAALGATIWNALPEPVRNALARLSPAESRAASERAQLPQRLFLEVTAPDLHELAFETLWSPGGELGRAPILYDHWQLVRYVPDPDRDAATRPRAGGGRFAALLLIGSFRALDPSDSNALPQVLRAIEAIRSQVRDLVVAGDSGAIDALATAAAGDGSGRGAKPRPRRGSARANAPPALVKLLRGARRLHGAHDLARLVAERKDAGGCGLVHFIGHSRPREDASEAAIELDLGAFALAADALAGHLEQLDTRVAVIDACRTADALARSLLRGADHVVTMGARVPFEWLARHCEELYGALAQRWPIAEAVRRARLGDGLAALGWIPRLYSRTDDPQPFLDAHGEALEVLRSRLFERLDSARDLGLPQGSDAVVRAVAGETYVEIQLGSKGGLEALFDGELREAKRGGLRLEQLVERLLDARGRTGVARGVTVCGNPGAGKTFMLRELARRLLVRHRSECVPLLVRLRDFAAGRDRDLLSFVAARERIPGRTRAAIEALLRAAADDGALLFLLDGLDEVPRHAGRAGRKRAPRQEVLQSIADLCADHPSCVVVLATRASAYDAERGRSLPPVDALPWGRARIEQFFERWLAVRFRSGPESEARAEDANDASRAAAAGDQAARSACLAALRAALDRSAAHERAQRRVVGASRTVSLVELCGTPLFARLAAQTAATRWCELRRRQGPAATGLALDFGASRADFFARVFDCLLEARHQDDDAQETRSMPEPEVARQVLRLLALDWTRQPRGKKDVDFERTRDEVISWLEGAKETVRARDGKRLELRRYLRARQRGWSGGAAGWLDLLVRRAEILVLEDDALCFRHRNLQEALAAEWLRERFEAAGGGRPGLDAVLGVVPREHGGGPRRRLKAAAAAPRAPDGGEEQHASGVWAEPCSLFESGLDVVDASSFVSRLLAPDSSPALGAYVFARSGRVTLDVLVQALAGSAKGSERRLTALRRVPELVHDAAARVEILERFGRESSDLVELATIEEALAAVEFAPRDAAIEPAVRAMAVRARFALPVGAPGEARPLELDDLVAQLARVPGFERARHGEVPALWRPIAPDGEGRPQPPGRWWMGSDEGEVGRWNDETRHEVELTQPYWMAAVPVTLGQFRLFAPDHAPFFDGRRVIGLTVEDSYEAARQRPRSGSVDATVPATDVDWYQACAWCRWLTAQLARCSSAVLAELGLALDAAQAAAIDAGALRVRASLPSEAQWEFAARGNGPQRNDRFWCGGDAGPDVAVLERDVQEGPQPVARWRDAALTQAGADGAVKDLAQVRRRNGFELFDVHGNVWEWCSDWFGDYEVGKEGAPIVDPRGAPSGDGRVVRGGGFGDVARFCRSAFRVGLGPGNRFWVRGFRVALSLVAVPQLGGSSVDH